VKLGDKQRLFAYLVPHLIQKALELGFEVTLGDANRSKEECERRGMKDSLHGKRLAIDLNLFRDGKYLKKTEDHLELGEWWEAQHEDCCWGGRFNDGNHYSLAHGGKQ